MSLPSLRIQGPLKICIVHHCRRCAHDFWSLASHIAVSSFYWMKHCPRCRFFILLSLITLQGDHASRVSIRITECNSIYITYVYTLVPHPKWLAHIHRVRRLIQIRRTLRPIEATSGLPTSLATPTLGASLISSRRSSLYDIVVAACAYYAYN